MLIHAEATALGAGIDSFDEYAFAYGSVVCRSLSGKNVMSKGTRVLKSARISNEAPRRLGAKTMNATANVHKWGLHIHKAVVRWLQDIEFCDSLLSMIESRTGRQLCQHMYRALRQIISSA